MARAKQARPDNEFILGKSEVGGFFVAAGFSAHGIAGAGGIGRQIASWIVDGEPELDLWKMDIRRFGPAYRSQAYTLARSIENYATYYDIHYPNEERQAGRPLRMSPTYDVLAALGASFGEKSGWERPNWFESNAAAGDEGAPTARLGRASTGRPRSVPRRWRRARRPGCSTRRSFAKIEVVRPRRGRVPPAHVPRTTSTVPVGSIIYTQLLDPRGGIQCDLTVTRVAADRLPVHHRHCIRATTTPPGCADISPMTARVAIHDLTSARVCFGAVGAAGSRHPPVASRATTCPTPASRT